MHVASDGWYRLRVPVRFRDLDAMGHAHHTLPLIYLEETRAAFYRDLTGNTDPATIDYVMAEITLRFHARIRYPADVEVALAVVHVGNKSFTTDFELRDSQDGVLLASGRAVQVAYDYARSLAKPIDVATRETLAAWHSARRRTDSPVSAIPRD